MTVSTGMQTRALKRAAAKFAAARVDRDQMIRDARQAGLSLREIAVASGLAVESVRRILKGATS